jgi:tetraacyldisaccharide 4'-kinase
VVLTRADLVDRESLGETMRQVRARTAAPVATGAFRPVAPPDLAGARVLVACGIGNPAAFVATVERLGAEVAETVFFPDHHAYGPRDAARLLGRGLPVVVTEKDAVKLETLWDGAVPLHVVRVEFEPLDGAAEIEAVLDRVCG